MQAPPAAPVRQAARARRLEPCWGLPASGRQHFQTAGSKPEAEGADAALGALPAAAAAPGSPNLKFTTMQEMLSLLPRWKASLVRRTAACSAVGMFCASKKEHGMSRMTKT